MMGALEILKLVGIFIMSPSLERCPNSYCKEISDTEICLGSVKSVDYISSTRWHGLNGDY